MFYHRLITWLLLAVVVLTLEQEVLVDYFLQQLQVHQEHIQ